MTTQIEGKHLFNRGRQPVKEFHSGKFTTDRDYRPEVHPPIWKLREEAQIG